MFSISYEILKNERDRISKVNDIGEFENEMNAILGQIQIIFENKTIGFVDNEIPYEGEFLITWFRLLNEALYILDTNGFATIYEPDSDNIWIEFKTNLNDIIINRIRTENSECITSDIECKPKTHAEVFWEEKVTKSEFYNSVLESTNVFIKDVLSLNQIMAEFREFKELININFKVQR